MPTPAPLMAHLPLPTLLPTPPDVGPMDLLNVKSSIERRENMLWFRVSGPGEAIGWRVCLVLRASQAASCKHRIAHPAYEVPTLPVLSLAFGCVQVPPKIYFKGGCLEVALRELKGKQRAFIVTGGCIVEAPAGHLGLARLACPVAHAAQTC